MRKITKIMYVTESGVETYSEVEAALMDLHDSVFEKDNHNRFLFHDIDGFVIAFPQIAKKIETYRKACRKADRRRRSIEKAKCGVESEGQKANDVCIA